MGKSRVRREFGKSGGLFEIMAGLALLDPLNVIFGIYWVEQASRLHLKDRRDACFTRILKNVGGSIR